MKKHLLVLAALAIGCSAFPQTFRSGKYRNIQKDLAGMVCENGVCKASVALDSFTYSVSAKESEDYFTVLAAVSGSTIMVEHFFLDGSMLKDPSSKGEWFSKKGKNKKRILTIGSFLESVFGYRPGRHPKKVSVFYLKKIQIRGMVSP